MRKIIILFVVLALFLTACTTPVTPKESEQKDTTATAAAKKEATAEPTAEPTPEPTPEPLPKVFAVVIAMEGYMHQEYQDTVDAVTAAGFEVEVVGETIGTAKGMGQETEVTKAFSEAKGADYAGIAVIGGGGVVDLWDNAELHRILNEVNDLNRAVGAICLAPVTLAKAGIVNEGEQVCWCNCDIADPEMEKEGVVDSCQPVTVVDNVVTGNGPNAAKEFGAALVTLLQS